MLVLSNEAGGHRRSTGRGRLDGSKMMEMGFGCVGLEELGDRTG